MLIMFFCVVRLALRSRRALSRDCAYDKYRDMPRISICIAILFLLLLIFTLPSRYAFDNKIFKINLEISAWICCRIWQYERNLPKQYRHAITRAGVSRSKIIIWFYYIDFVVLLMCCILFRRIFSARRLAREDIFIFRLSTFIRRLSIYSFHLTNARACYA